MKCTECKDYEQCRKKYDLRLKRSKCSKAKDIYVPTNADHIRSMTDEELANLLLNGNAPEVCPNGCDECNGDCDGRMLDWLKQPYKEGE